MGIVLRKRLAQFRRISKHALHTKLLTFGGISNFHSLFHILLSTCAHECSASSTLFNFLATWYAVLTVNWCALFSFQYNWSRASVLSSWMRRISSWVDCVKVAYIKGLFHCMVYWSNRSPTFIVVSTPSLKRGGWGNHLLELTIMLYPFPIFHFNPSRIRSLADNKLHHTKEGLWPSSASMNELLGKYLTLYTQ